MFANWRGQTWCGCSGAFVIDAMRFTKFNIAKLFVLMEVVYKTAHIKIAHIMHIYTAGVLIKLLCCRLLTQLSASNSIVFLIRKTCSFSRAWVAASRYHRLGSEWKWECKRQCRFPFCALFLITVSPIVNYIAISTWLFMSGDDTLSFLSATHGSF